MCGMPVSPSRCERFGRIVLRGYCAVGICGTELSIFVRISPNKNLVPGCEQFRAVATGHGFGVRSKNPPFCTESPK